MFRRVPAKEQARLQSLRVFGVIVRALSSDKHGVQPLSVTIEAVGQPRAGVTTAVALLEVGEPGASEGKVRPRLKRRNWKLGSVVVKHPIIPPPFCRRRGMMQRTEG